MNLNSNEYTIIKYKIEDALHKNKIQLFGYNFIEKEEIKNKCKIEINGIKYDISEYYELPLDFQNEHK